MPEEKDIAAVSPIDTPPGNGNRDGDLVDRQTRKKSRSVSSTGKVKALKTELRALVQENAELRDQLLRKTADFENYKKRRESEYLQLVENASAQVLSGLLPILDDLERSMKSARESGDSASFLEGIELIYKNLLKTVEGHGVKPIPAVGKEFDPELHEALMQVANSDYPPGTVVEEHLKGYSIRDRVLRHSQVLVSK